MEEYTKKQFTFQGKTVEELKTLDVREFSKFLRSRERRTVLRNFQEVEDFVNLAKEKVTKNKPIRTHSRHIVIVPGLIGIKIQVYNGKSFVPILITEDMLGHRLGELAPTRPKIKHGSAGIGGTKGTKAKAKK